ncbi:MAG TPA: nucleoside triphosphate pyrophosphohydrolase, partial [Chromatiales bacterium]|nr:nucleoside triphosphate pyrophosphohydrolase [Chromatiales bacterium]
PVLEKLEEEVGELRAALDPNEAPERVAEELGDVLFTCVNLARHAGVDPEAALRGANTRFERRFRYIESRLREQGRVPEKAPPEELDALWREAKAEETGATTTGEPGDR